MRVFRKFVERLSYYHNWSFGVSHDACSAKYCTCKFSLYSPPLLPSLSCSSVSKWYARNIAQTVGSHISSFRHFAHVGQISPIPYILPMLGRRAIPFERFNRNLCLKVSNVYCGNAIISFFSSHCF